MATIKKVPRITNTAQLAERANPRNPRKISEEQLKMLLASLKRFGDLSGLVLNRATQHLVGGHQRVKLLGECPVTITQRYEAPTGTGTVAEGYVTFEGERFVYREVQWDEKMEEAAMIAANKHGGDWDFPALSELLMELDQSDFDLSVTGFSAAELERMVKGVAPSNEDEITPLSSEEVGIMPAQIRMVQLFLTIDTLPGFLDKVRALQQGYGTQNVTDTVVQAIDQCYQSAHANLSERNKDQADHPVGLSGTENGASEGSPTTEGSTD